MVRRWSGGGASTCQRRVVGVACAVLGTVLPVSAQSEWACEELSNRISAQDRPGGLAFEGPNFWVGSMRAWVSDLMCIDPGTGAVLRTIPAPGPLIGGLAWDGETLWCLPEQSGIIYQLDPLDGSVLHSIPAPSFGQVNPNGADLAWDGDTLWHVDYSDRMLYQLDPVDGTILQAFATPGSLPTGLGWAREGLVLSDASTHRMYVIDPTDGAVLHSCLVPGSFPTGVGVSPDATVYYMDTVTEREREYDLGLSVEGPSPFTNYCVARPNSTGEPALMGARGSASLSADDLVLTAGPMPPALGIFVYGPRPADGTFHRSCVAGRRRRVGRVVFPHAGSMEQRLDHDRRGRGRGSIVAGSTWYFQGWYLDRRGRGRPRVNATDGLEIVFEP